MLNTTTIVEGGSALYFPIRPDVDEAVRVYHVDRSYYGNPLGPLPLVELTDNLPNSLLQVPGMVWGSSSSMSARAKTNSPCLGDMVVCVKKTGAVTLGFFTSRYYSDDFLDKFPFVTWPESKDTKLSKKNGFLYFPGSFLDQGLLYQVKEIMKRNGNT